MQSERSEEEQEREKCGCECSVISRVAHLIAASNHPSEGIDEEGMRNIHEPRGVGQNLGERSRATMLWVRKEKVLARTGEGERKSSVE